MGLFDVDGFGDRKPLDDIQVKKDDDKEFQENSFEESLVNDVSPLVKVEVINKRFNLGKLLKNLGYRIEIGNIYCPFHDDEATGKPSAKYHEDTDLLYCFSENKMYSAYHALKFLYGKDVNDIFRSIWIQMTEMERKEILSRYDSEGNHKITKQEKSLWDVYQEKVLDMFKMGKVNYTQYKNALYKVLMIIKDSEKKGEI